MQAWGTSDRRQFVLIHDQVLAVFTAYRQLTKEAKEAGGILLGKRRGNHIELCVATVPTIHDKRARTLFTRQPQIHQEFADSVWANSKGGISYVGEWHTHPEAIPQPSSIDVANALDIVERHADTVLFVIVGTLALHVQITKIDDTKVLQILEA